MNVFQSSCCSLLAALVLFLLHGSCAAEDVEVVHKAVGDSLDLPFNYPKDKPHVEWKFNEKTFAEYVGNQTNLVQPPLFPQRIKINIDKISIKIEGLKHQDSGNFSIVATRGGDQLPTKLIELRIHTRIKDVKIVSEISWLSKNCTIHLRCETPDDLNSSYSWIIGDKRIKKPGPQLTISLRPAENSTVTCNASNPSSSMKAEQNVVCTEKPKDTPASAGFRLELWLTVGVSILIVIILSVITVVCFQWRRRNGQTESEAGITVYEDIQTDGPAKKRSESVVNAMSIYETVDDLKVNKNAPQTFYDKINYQRHPPASASASTPSPSPYQKVL